MRPLDALGILEIDFRCWTNAWIYHLGDIHIYVYIYGYFQRVI